MSVFYNRTRRSASIPRRLLGEGKIHLIPVYYLARLSRLGREAIERSGSYDFADHIYEGRPEGEGALGYLLDAAFLRLPIARAFRARYLYASSELHRLVDETPRGRTREILAVPCGLARELFDLARRLESAPAQDRERVRLHGVDLDCELVERLMRRVSGRSVNLDFSCGDALSARAYPPGVAYDMIISLGFVEFLEDETAVRFYALVRDRLAQGGAFVTSGLARYALADYLLRNVAELRAFYRTEEDLRRLAARAGFTSIRTYQDETRLQTMLVAGRT